jgi:hypothetical protein
MGTFLIANLGFPNFCEVSQCLTQLMYVYIYQWIIDIRLKRNLVEVPRENSFSLSLGIEPTAFRKKHSFSKVNAAVLTKSS